MRMQSQISAVFALIVGTAVAQAAVPLLNATCPAGISVHADKGGPIYINAKRANLKKFNNNYYEAKLGRVTIELTINPDGSASVSYNKRGSGNGICNVSNDGTSDGADSGSSGNALTGSNLAQGGYERAQKACLNAVANRVGVSSSGVYATDVMWSQAGVGVTISAQNHVWACQSSEAGRVAGIRRTQ